MEGSVCLPDGWKPGAAWAACTFLSCVAWVLPGPAWSHLGVPHLPPGSGGRWAWPHGGVLGHSGRVGHGGWARRPAQLPK